jgi:hypothetical protein
VLVATLAGALVAARGIGLRGGSRRIEFLREARDEDRGESREHLRNTNFLALFNLPLQPFDLATQIELVLLFELEPLVLLSRLRGGCSQPSTNLSELVVCAREAPLQLPQAAAAKPERMRRWRA